MNHSSGELLRNDCNQDQYSDEKMQSPKVFVSYSHDSEEHIEWVLKLATRLRRNGVEMLLDSWIRLGEELNKFMEGGLSKSKRVLCICSENYEIKASKGNDGVGREIQIIAANTDKINEKWVIPVIRNNAKSPRIPKLLSRKKYINFEDNSLYEDRYKELLRELLDKPVLKKHSVGKSPLENIKHFAEPKLMPDPEKYTSPAPRGTATFDYSNNNGNYCIGQDCLRFIISFSKASDKSIHFCAKPNRTKVAVVKDQDDIDYIDDAGRYDYSSRCRKPKCNQIALVLNANGFYAAIKILNIKDDTRDDKFDEVTFDYTIQTNGSPDFTSNRNWFKGLASQSTSKEEEQDSIRDYVAAQSPSKVSSSVVQPKLAITDATTTTIKQPRHCDTQANYDRAEPFFKHALAIDEEALGSGQPEITNSLNNLASLYKTQGNYDQAETLFKRALAIAKKALGPDHPSVATALGYIAQLYKNANIDKQANDLNELNDPRRPSRNVFISYAHGNRKNKVWVQEFAERLRSDGIDIILDQWDSLPGMNVKQFMKDGLKKSRKVLCICSRDYCLKATKGAGGVGYEKKIMLNEMKLKQRSKKWIPVIRNNPHPSQMPRFLNGRFSIDLRYSKSYDENYKKLLGFLTEKQLLSKPPLGKRPSVNGVPTGKQELAPDTTSYVSRSLKGNVVFNYSNNDGSFSIGHSEMLFELIFSKASDKSIYFYRDGKNVKQVARVKDKENICDIDDAAYYDYSSRVRSIEIHQIGLAQNVNGYYAAIRILGIKDDSRDSVYDEVCFDYVIQANRSSDFRP